LFVFEQHNGKDTKKLLKQLLQHAIAIYEKSIQKKYRIAKDSRVYCVFEFHSIMQAVMARIKDDRIFVKFKDHFLFKTCDKMKDDFFYGWQTFDSRMVDFLGKEHVPSKTTS